MATTQETAPATQSSGELNNPVENGHQQKESANKPDSEAQLPQTFEADADDLGLPLSAADGVIKKPFARPLDTAKPVPPPELTSDQAAKYDQVLKAVSSWTTIPSSSAKDASDTPLTDDERMFLTRECLLRYLRATKWNVSEAVNRIRSTLIWRREYIGDKLTPEYISIENETGKQVILGYDVNGRPCHYLLPSRQNTEKSDRQIEHLVYMLERVIDLMPPGQETLALVVNFNETKSGQNSSIGQAKQTLHFLQNHYPERLGRALVINIPFVIWGFFKMITPFIDPVTRQKLKFNEDLRQHVPPAQLMKATGGDVEFEYDHSVYWPALTKLAEQRRKAYRERWIRGGKRIGEYEDYLKGGTAKSLAAREGKSASDELGEKMEALKVDAPAASS
ncbi:hypothetical protein VTN77DRAFT_3841 [Rasamsonia byssochlamydoides]|uniref:uncharacterized protein n=1 Tax=Rasamsonia byssochlamydoides TaxID=89139 RepID=UPI0037444293